MTSSMKKQYSSMWAPRFRATAAWQHGGIRRCADPGEHVPHTHGGYRTVRYGRVPYLCPGDAADRITTLHEGDAMTLAISGLDVERGEER